MAESPITAISSPALQSVTTNTTPTTVSFDIASIPENIGVDYLGNLNMNHTIDSDTPPPPPPKPSSHEVSRGGTPQTNQPLPLQESYSAQDPRFRNGTQSPYRYANAHAQAQAPFPGLPTLDESWLPDTVKDKSTIDLQSILKNPALISALSSQHPSSTAHQQHLQSTLKHNQDLATHLLELQSHLTDLRSSTETLLLKHQSLEVSWRKKQTEMDEALAPWSPKALYQRLSASITEQEAVCQAVEESFLEEDHHGRVPEKEVVDWIRRIRAEGAKLAARREAKARWDEGRVGGWR